MTVAAVAPDRGRTGVVGVGRVAPGRTEALSVAAPPVHRLELDTLTSQWQRALDAAQMALAAAAVSLSAAELVRRQRELTLERREVAESLARTARAAGVRPVPWLSPVPVPASSLGLPAGIRASLFDLDGVLTDSGLLHAWAWGEVFDEFLLRLSEKTGWHFIPFDRVADYRAYIEGRPRIEGVHTFLQSRGDPSARRESRGVCRRRYGLWTRAAEGRDARSRAAPRRCDRCCRSASLSRGRRSRRAHTSSGLGECEHADDARAGWARASLVEMRIDAQVISAEELRSPPAPDLLLCLLVVAWASVQTTSSTSPTALPASPRGRRPGLLSSESATRPKGSSCPALARSAPQPL